MDLKIFVIGDPHLRSRYIKTAEEVVERSLDEAKKANPDIIVVLGDTFDTNDVVKNTPFRLCEKLFIGLNEIAPLYVLVGNHDLCNPSQFLTEAHFFGLYKQLGIHIVDTGLIKIINGKKITFVPYVPDGRFKEALSQISKTCGKKWSDSNLIFAHQNFKGSIEGCTSGDGWSKNFPKVISGHIHTEITLPFGVYYPGSPSQVHFSEPPNKNFWLVTLKDKGFSYKKIPTRIRGKTTLEFFKVEDVKSAYMAGELESDLLDIKVNIMLSPEERASFVKTNLYKTLKNQINCNVIKVEPKVQISSTKKTFLEILKESLDESGNKTLEEVLSNKPIIRIK